MVAKSQADLKSRSIELAGWLMGFAWLTIIIPAAIIVLLPDGDRPAAAAAWATTPFLEYLAVSIGIGFGLSPVFSFLIIVLPCIGLAMLVVGLLGFLGDSSARAKRFLAKVPAKIEKYPRLKKYGVASNFFSSCSSASTSPRECH